LRDGHTNTPADKLQHYTCAPPSSPHPCAAHAQGMHAERDSSMTVAHTIVANAAAHARYPGANPHSVVHGNQRGANRTPFGARDDTRPRRHPPLLASVRSSDLRCTLKTDGAYEAHTHQPAPPEASRASALPKKLEKMRKKKGEEQRGEEGEDEEGGRGRGRGRGSGGGGREHEAMHAPRKNANGGTEQPIRTQRRAQPAPQHQNSPPPLERTPNAVPQPRTVHLLIAGAEGVIVSVLC
jgi:hypothetical protein